MNCNLYQPSKQNPTIFKFIQKSHDDSTLKDCRQFVKVSATIANEYMHLKFNHTCKRENIMPKSLNFVPPIRSKEGFKLAHQFGLKFLNLRITNSHRKIKEKSLTLNLLTQKIKGILSNKQFSELNNYVTSKLKNQNKNTERRHQKKLELLKQKDDSNKNTIGPKLTQKFVGNEIADTSNRNLNDLNATIDTTKWVVNLSARLLTEDEISILKKGFKFAVAPQSIPVSNMLCAVEKGLEAINDQSIADMARAKITTVIKNAKPPEPNVTPQEMNALKTLRNEKEIVVLKADKGNTTVVMDRAEYNIKMNNLLNDKNTYKKVGNNNLKPVAETLNRFIHRLSEEQKISKSQFYNLRCSEIRAPRIYGLVKLHKINHPLRPIVSMCGTPTYNLSKYLSRNIISKLIKYDYILRNSYDFVNSLKNLTIDKDEIQVSFDVISLFTSIPKELAKNVVLDKFTSIETDIDTKFDIEDLKMALEICFSSTIFLFENQFYWQIFGLPMGGPSSSDLANLTMSHIEHKAITGFISPPKCWKRFMDDIYSIIKKQHIEKFLKHINSISPSIQFTVEFENEDKISFLDVNVHRTLQGDLRTSIYRKPTHSNRYLNFESHHPLIQKLAVPNTLYHRANHIITDTESRHNEIKQIQKTLQANGFPKKFTYSKQPKRKTTTQEKQKYLGYTTIPYVKNVSEKIKRILNDVSIKSTFKPLRTIRHFIPQPKDPIQEKETYGVIYQVPCKNCEESYIGQTKRNINTRLKEHRTAVKKGRIQKSALSEHVMNKVHLIDWQNAKIIQQESNYKKRLFLESWHINKNPKTMNRKDGSNLPNVYKSLLPVPID